MSKLLLTGAASAAAYRIKAILNTDVLVLGDYEPLPALASLLVLPSPLNVTYIHDFLKICLEQEITSVYSIRREEAKVLASARLLLAEYGIELFLPSNILIDDVPVFKTSECKALDLKPDGLFWQDHQMNNHLFFCD